MKYLNCKIKNSMLALAISVFSVTTAWADDFSDRTNTVYLIADYGLGTYKSLLVNSNDTMGVVTYGFGANAGADRNLGFEYRVETQTTSFIVNQSSIATIWTSTIFKYRLWAFELGPVIGNAQVKANREGTEIMDAVGSGYGGYFGILMPLGRNSMLYLNAMSVATADPIDRKERTIGIGSRLDVELGGKIGITRKALDFTLGYRRRANTLSEGGTGYNELQTATFVGFNLGTTF